MEKYTSTPRTHLSFMIEHIIKFLIIYHACDIHMLLAFKNVKNETIFRVITFQWM